MNKSEFPKAEEIPDSADTRLSEDEAHEEANRMRAHLGADERGQVEKPDYERRSQYPNWRFYGATHMENPTPEDYDKALEAVEKIKRLAEEEPDSQKTMYQIGRILQRTGQAAGLVAVIFGSLFVGRASDIGRVEDYQKRMREDLVDAEKRLRDLKKAAEKFGKKESH